MALSADSPSKLNEKCLTIQQFFCSFSLHLFDWLTYVFHSSVVLLVSIGFQWRKVNNNCMHNDKRKLYASLFFRFLFFFVPKKSNGIIFYYDMILNETAWGLKLKILFDFESVWAVLSLCYGVRICSLFFRLLSSFTPLSFRFIFRNISCDLRCGCTVCKH